MMPVPSDICNHADQMVFQNAVNDIFVNIRLPRMQSNAGMAITRENASATMLTACEGPDLPE